MLEGRDGRRGAETSTAAALQIQEQRGKPKQIEGDNHSPGCHLSRTILSTKLYLGRSWNKPFRSPSEGKRKAQGMGLFCCEKQLAAPGKSLPGTPGSFGLWLPSHCSVSAPKIQLRILNFCLPIFKSTLCFLDYSKKNPNSIIILIICDLIYSDTSRLTVLLLSCLFFWLL